MACPKIRSETPGRKEDLPDEKMNEFHEDRQVNIHHFRDHGYAWVVLAAAVFTASLVTANTSTYGILLPEYVDYFQVSKSEITLIQSLFAGAAAAIGKTFYINSQQNYCKVT